MYFGDNPMVFQDANTFLLKRMLVPSLFSSPNGSCSGLSEHMGPKIQWFIIHFPIQILIFGSQFHTTLITGRDTRAFGIEGTCRSLQEYQITNPQPPNNFTMFFLGCTNLEKTLVLLRFHSLSDNWNQQKTGSSILIFFNSSTEHK